MKNIPLDDIEDVSYFSNQIISHTFEMLKDQDFKIAMASIYTAFVDLSLSQADDLGEAWFFRKAFIEDFDTRMLKRFLF